MKNLLRTVFVLGCQLIWGQNTISVIPTSVGFEDNFSVEVSLDNAQEIAALQFDLTYNESALELSTGHVLTYATDTHDLSTSPIDSNTLRVIVYSLSNDVLESSAGVILNIFFNSKTEPGNFYTSISNLVMSDVNGDQVTANSSGANVTVLGPKFNLLTTNVEFGNVPMNSTSNRYITVQNDGNQELIISSISFSAPVGISNSLPIAISSGASASIELSLDTSIKQEFNQTALFSTNDLDQVRELQETSIHANIYAVNEIQIGSATGNTNTPISVPVRVDNMEPFNGLQLDIQLPSGMSYVDESINFSGREVDHDIVASVNEFNVLRVLAYSISNTDFNDTSGEVFSFMINPNENFGYYDLNFAEPILSNLELGNIVSETYSGSLYINVGDLILSPVPLDLGRVPITSPSVLGNITLLNSGDAPLTVSAINYSDTALNSAITVPLQLEVSQSSGQEVEFIPSDLGLFSGTITFSHDGSSAESTLEVTADVYAPNYLHHEEKYVFRDESYDIKLELSNYDDLRAIQFDITIPSEFTFDFSASQAMAALDGFSMSSSDLGDGTYRFVIYNLSDLAISSGTNHLLNLPIYVSNSAAFGDYTFELTNVVLSNIANQNASSEALETGVIHITEYDGPIAIDDFVEVLEDSDLTSIDVLSNDAGIAALAIILTDVSSTGSGTVSLNADGVSVDYTPAPDFFGTEVVSYIISDGTNPNSTATLTINVVPVNDAPIALDDTIVVDQGIAEVISLMATDVDSDVFTFTIVDQPANGSVTLDGDQATYTANASYIGSDSFTFTVSDGALTSNIGTISIDVTLDAVSYILQNLKSYPNPFDAYYTIHSDLSLKLEVLDMSGKIVLYKSIEPGSTTIDTSKFTTGVYVFKLYHLGSSTSQILIKR